MPDSVAIGEIGKLLGSGGAVIVLVVYLFRALPPSSRGREDQAFQTLMDMSKKLDETNAEISRKLDEARRERADLRDRLTVVEITQTFTLEKIRKEGGE